MLDTDEMKGENGWGSVIELLKTHYQKYDNSLAFETWKEFCTFNRKEGQPIDDYMCYEKYKVRMRHFNTDLGEHIHRLNLSCAGIYLSNFDVCQTAQKVSLLTEFSNSIFIKKTFGKNVSILALNFFSKYIGLLLGFFYLSYLFILQM